MAAAIETRGLTKYYGKTRGIEDLNIQVRPGEILGFLGPNGAGKTTTIRLLLGFLIPTRGEARIFERVAGAGSLAIREEIGYIPGDVRLYPKMTGHRLLDYFGGFKPRKASELREQLATRFDLDLDKKVGDLSRGNRQKLAIVMALMQRPRLLILDEPTLGLDPLMQREFYQVVRELKDRGATVFLSSHILSEVEKACDRVVVIGNGRLLAEETIDEIVGKKLHHLEVTFAQDVDPALLDVPGLSKVERENRTVRAVFKGEPDALIKALARAKVVDISLARASLEEVFFEFYRKGGQADEP